MNTPYVQVKTKFQVTIPPNVRKHLGLKVGDILEAKNERGKITLAPKRVVDKHKAFIDAHIAEGLKDIEEGRTYGPFDTWEAMIVSLHKESRKLHAKRKAHRLT